MSRREGIAIVVLIVAAVAFVLFYVNQQHRAEIASVPVSPSTRSQIEAALAQSRPASEPRIIETNTRLLEEGQFYISSFRLMRPATVFVQVSLKSGAAIDSYFVGERGLNGWKAMAANGRSVRFPYLPSLTMAPLDGDYDHSAPLPAGEYALVIDNSRLGATAPPFHLFKRTPALVAYEIKIED